MSAVGTKDICRAYGTHLRRLKFHRLKPVATGIAPLTRLYFVLIWARYFDGRPKRRSVTGALNRLG
jgi:hypothetical protein